MNDIRMSPPDPVRPGPGALTLVVSFSMIAFMLSLFAVPVDPLPGALGIASLERGEWWSVLTHIFTHKDLGHLLSNMILLVLAGRAVERNAGSRHFVYIFLTGAWGGAALQLCLHPESSLAGASGGVWSVIGAYAALHPEADLMRPFRRYIKLRLKAKRLLPAFLAVHAGMEIVVRTVPDADWSGVSRVAHLAHAGGLLAGWLYGRRLAMDNPPADTGNDLFPMGLRRRRFREGHPVGVNRGGVFPHEETLEPSLPVIPPPPPELSDSEFLRERVDPVLEKLYAGGPETLTPEEKAVLAEASRRFAKGKQ